MWVNALEARRLLSTAVLSGNTLTITGTDARNIIYFNYSGALHKAYATDSTAGGPTTTLGQWDPALIKKVIVNLKGDNDLFSVPTEMPVPPTMMIDAGAGNDIAAAGSGNTTTLGGLGNDILNGGGGNDSIDGGDGNDQIVGGAGNDSIFGGLGDDPISAGDGNDLIDGGLGSDEMHGQLGTDTVTYASRTAAV